MDPKTTERLFVSATMRELGYDRFWQVAAAQLRRAFLSNRHFLCRSVSASPVVWPDLHAHDQPPQHFCPCSACSHYLPESLAHRKSSCRSTSQMSSPTPSFSTRSGQSTLGSLKLWDLRPTWSGKPARPTMISLAIWKPSSQPSTARRVQSCASKRTHLISTLRCAERWPPDDQSLRLSARPLLLEPRRHLGASGPGRSDGPCALHDRANRQGGDHGQLFRPAYLRVACRPRAFNYFVPETAPEGMSEAEAKAANYGVFSARYGNVYTVKQAVQLIERAFGEATYDEVWELGDRFVDPFRPQIQPKGFETREALEASRRHPSRRRAPRLRRGRRPGLHPRSDRGLAVDQDGGRLSDRAGASPAAAMIRPSTRR